MKRFLACILACVLLLGSVGALAEDWTTKGITLTFIHDHTDDSVEKVVSSTGFRAMVDKYKADHPNVILEELKTSDLTTQIMQQASADNLMDVVRLSYGLMPITAGAGQLVDLTDMVDPSEYFDNCFAATYNGRIYALPMRGSEYNYLYYNEEMLKEATGSTEFPKTMAEFLALDEYFDAKGIDLIALGNKVAWWTPGLIVTPLLHEYCGPEKARSLILSEGKYAWTDEDVVSAFEWLPKIAATCNADFNQQDDIWAAGWYAQGKAFCYPCGSWGGNTMNTFKNDFPETIAATRCTIIPSVSGKKEDTYISGSAGDSYGISAKLQPGTPEFDAAFALIRQICSKEYADFMIANGSIAAPLSDTVVDTSNFPAMVQDFLALHNGGYPNALAMQNFIESSVFNVMNANLALVMAGEMSVTDMLIKVEKADQEYRADRE